MPRTAPIGNFPSGFARPEPTAVALEDVRDAGPPRKPVYRLRTTSEAPPRALSSAFDTVQKGPPRATGDGCRSPKRVDLQGYLEERTARATLEVHKKRLKLTVDDLERDGHFTYEGQLDESFCEHKGEGDLLGLYATVEAKGTPLPRVDVSLDRNSYSDPGRHRIRVDGSAKGRYANVLTLIETPADRVHLRDAYQKVKNESSDVHAAVRRSNGDEIVASCALLADGTVLLTELEANRRSRKHAIGTELSCNDQESHVELSAYELAPDLTLLAIVVRGENCGAKCGDSAGAELWTLTNDGFHFGRKLPATHENPGGLNYDSSSSEVRLCWVDADGAPPFEVLLSADGTSPSDRAASISGRDPGSGTFSRVELLPLGPPYRGFCNGEIVRY